MLRWLPAEDLVHDKADVFEFEENVAAFEDFLQITVTELGYQVNLVKIVESLFFWNEDLNHSDDVGVSAVLQEDDFPQNTTSFGRSLE